MEDTSQFQSLVITVALDVSVLWEIWAIRAPCAGCLGRLCSDIAVSRQLTLLTDSDRLATFPTFGKHALYPFFLRWSRNKSFPILAVTKEDHHKDNKMHQYKSEDCKSGEKKLKETQVSSWTAQCLMHPEDPTICK